MFSNGISPVTIRAGWAALAVHATPINSEADDITRPASSNDGRMYGSPSPPNGLGELLM